jgi:hypothetical protein
LTCPEQTLAVVNIREWLHKLAGALRALRPDEETRRRTRYFVFELLERNLPHAEDQQPTESPLSLRGGGR